MKGFTMKDGASLGAAILVLGLCFIFIPLMPLIRGVIGFALAGAVFVGVGFILDPKTKTDIAEDEAESDFQATLRRIEDIALAADEASKRSTRRQAAGQLSHISSMIHQLHSRFSKAGRKDAVNAARLAHLLEQFGVSLDRYQKIVTGQLFLPATDKKREIDETELRDLPMVERVLENLGINLDSGQTSELDVAQATFATLAKSYGLLEEIDREGKS